MRKYTPLFLGSLLLMASCTAQTPRPETGLKPTPAENPGIPVPRDTEVGVDAKALFAAKCAGCHGPEAAKLKGKAADYYVNALNGYKAKTFGGAKKEIMETRAAQLSDAEVKALSKYVAAQ